MQTFVVIYVAVGFVVGIRLFGSAALASVRRYGFRSAVTDATRKHYDELPLYWRTPVAAWLGIIGLPLLAGWAFIREGFDAGESCPCCCSGSAASRFCAGTSGRRHGDGL